MKKTILVCGASKNLGRFITEQFAKEQHNVFSISRSNVKIFKNIKHIKCNLLKINQNFHHQVLCRVFYYKFYNHRK